MVPLRCGVKCRCLRLAASDELLLDHSFVSLLDRLPPLSLFECKTLLLSGCCEGNEASEFRSPSITKTAVSVSSACALVCPCVCACGRAEVSRRISAHFRSLKETTASWGGAAYRYVVFISIQLVAISPCVSRFLFLSKREMTNGAFASRFGVSDGSVPPFFVGDRRRC